MKEEQLSPNELVKECLYEALIILMKTKDFSDISIIEITKKAGVSRMAYYRNYSSKLSIITIYLDELFGQYLGTVEGFTDMDTHLFAQNFFSYFKKEQDLIECLIKSKMSYLLLERFDAYMQIIFRKIHPPSEVVEKSNRYIQHFFTGGLFNLLIEWVSSGMFETEDEMAQLIEQFKKHP